LLDAASEKNGNFVRCLLPLGWGLDDFHWLQASKSDCHEPQRLNLRLLSAHPLWQRNSVHAESGTMQHPFWSVINMPAGNRDGQPSVPDLPGVWLLVLSVTAIRGAILPFHAISQGLKS
jgi:hypothetical protein